MLKLFGPYDSLMSNGSQVLLKELAAIGPIECIETLQLVRLPPVLYNSYHFGQPVQSRSPK